MNCIICQNPVEQKGFNAMPVADGRCCERCDDLIVTPARLAAETGKPPAHFFEIADRLHAMSKALKKQLREQDTF